MDEVQAIQSLVEVKAIAFQDSKYELTGQRPDLRGDFEGGRRIRHYWFQQALKKLRVQNTRLNRIVFVARFLV